MNGKVLLDTNAVIAIFASDPEVHSVVAGSECFVPSIVAGELLYGAERSSNTLDNIRRVNEFCSQVAVIPCDIETAAHYGKLKNRLRTAGTPIPENDLWIAAIAVQAGLPLLSQDRHFDTIREVTRTEW